MGIISRYFWTGIAEMVVLIGMYLAILYGVPFLVVAFGG